MLIIYDCVNAQIAPSQVYAPPLSLGQGSLDSTLAIGGFQATNPKPYIPRRLNLSAYRWFRDIVPAEARSGITLYRAFVVQTSTAVTALKVWLGDANGNYASTAANAVTGATLTMGVDPAAASQLGAISPNETTAPAGVVFSSPTSGAPLDLGAMAAGQSRIVWMCLTIPVNCPAVQSDYQIFSLRPDTTNGTGSPVSFEHWWNVVSGVKFGTVTTDMVSRVITQPRGCTFTLNVVDAATGLTNTDPGGAYATPSVLVQTTFTDAASGSVYRSMDTCRRLGPGLFQFRFWPAAPGHYLLMFDIAEDTFFVPIEVAAVGDDSATIIPLTFASGSGGGGISGIGVLVNNLIAGTEAYINLIAGNANITLVGVDASPQVNVTFKAFVSVEKAGALIGTRTNLNLIQGANITLTVTDNPGADSVDVTIASSGGGGGGGGGDFFFGDGSDGALVFDGTTTILGIVPSGNVYLLTHDIYATNITVNAGVTIDEGFGFQYLIYANNLVVNGTIKADGDPAVGATRGNGFNGSTGRFALESEYGGTTGSPGGNAPNALGGAGGAGGAGNGGAGGFGGTAGQGLDKYTGGSLRFLHQWGWWTGGGSAAANWLGNNSGVAGGGGGGGQGSAGSGGGGGAGAGAIIICARSIVGTGSIHCDGGAGGNAPGTNAGGGGGGGGGLINIFYGNMSGVATHCNGGAGGTGTGTGSNGVAGSAGNVILVQVSAAGAGSGANVNDNFWVATAAGSADLPNAKVLGGLATGLVKNTTATGTPTIAVPAVDYESPLTNQNQQTTYAEDTGAANAYVAAMTPAVTAYTEGQRFTVEIAHANSGPSTLNINGLGTKTIILPSGASLSGGELVPGQTATFVYDGANFQLISASALPPGVASFTRGHGLAFFVLTTVWQAGVTQINNIPYVPTGIIVFTNSVGDPIRGTFTYDAPTQTVTAANTVAGDGVRYVLIIC